MPINFLEAVQAALRHQWLVYQPTSEGSLSNPPAISWLVYQPTSIDLLRPSPSVCTQSLSDQLVSIPTNLRWVMQLKVFDSVTHDLSMCQTTLVTHNCVPMKTSRTTTHPERRKATAVQTQGGRCAVGGLRLPVAVGVGLGWRRGWWVVDELGWMLS